MVRMPTPTPSSRSLCLHGHDGREREKAIFHDSGGGDDGSHKPCTLAALLLLPGCERIRLDLGRVEGSYKVHLSRMTAQKLQEISPHKSKKWSYVGMHKHQRVSWFMPPRKRQRQKGRRKEEKNRDICQHTHVDVSMDQRVQLFCEAPLIYSAKRTFQFGSNAWNSFLSKRGKAFQPVAQNAYLLGPSEGYVHSLKPGSSRRSAYYKGMGKVNALAFTGFRDARWNQLVLTREAVNLPHACNLDAGKKEGWTSGPHVE